MITASAGDSGHMSMLERLRASSGRALIGLLRADVALVAGVAAPRPPVDAVRGQAGVLRRVSEGPVDEMGRLSA